MSYLVHDNCICLRLPLSVLLSVPMSDARQCIAEKTSSNCLAGPNDRKIPYLPVSIMLQWRMWTHLGWLRQAISRVSKLDRVGGGFHRANSQAGVVVTPKVQAHNPHHTQVHFMQQAQRPWCIRVAEQPAVQRCHVLCERVCVICVDAIPGGEGAMGVLWSCRWIVMRGQQHHQ